MKRLTAVLVPLAAALAIAGCGSSSSTPTSAPRSVGAAPVASGSPAPRMRLEDARSGTVFDTASLRGRPYMVTFLSSRCAAIGKELRRAVEELGPASSRVAVLVVSAYPRVDTASSARSWLRALGAPPSFHFLVGSERQLRPYWSAWGFAPEGGRGAGSGCAPATPVYLVTTAGRSAGVIYAGAQVPSSSLAHDLRALLGG